MVVLVYKNRDWLLTALMCCFLAVSTQSLLAAHLMQSAKTHACCHGHSSSEKSEHQGPKHDCSKCDICKKLLGLFDNFICNKARSVNLIANQVIEKAYCEFIIVDQYHLSQNLTRGPPLS